MEWVEVVPETKRDFPNPLEQPTNTNKGRHKRQRKKNKKRKELWENFTSSTKYNVKDNNFKDISENVQKNNNVTLDAWTDSYYKIINWQYKHQIAFWKARATSLEIENNILHDIIRSNNMESNAESSGVESSDKTTNAEEEENSYDSEDSMTDEINSDVEINDVFVDFLVKNAKYRADAKREREKFKNQNDNEEKGKLEKTVPVDSSAELEHAINNLKTLYGDNWQKISSLEIALKSQFVENVDKLKPSFWPIYPLSL